jgi:hypothetical protein
MPTKTPLEIAQPLTVPIGMDFYETYIKRRGEFDNHYKILLKRNEMDKDTYNAYRHLYALGVSDSLN